MWNWLMCKLKGHEWRFNFVGCPDLHDRRNCERCKRRDEYRWNGNNTEWRRIL